MRTAAVEAEIAEALAAAQPENPAAREQAEAARRRAQETAEALGQQASEEQPERFLPSDRLKKLYREQGHIRLQPANPAMQAIIVEADQVQIQGVVIGVMRRY